jgi:hypothetical protein
MSVVPTHGSCPDAWEQCLGEDGSLRASFMIYLIGKSTFSPLCVCAEGDGRPGRASCQQSTLLLTRYLPINWLPLGHYLYLVNSQLCTNYQ